eukprot:scaffold2140_cov394-Prasinococcus_capsulatus_cf.AAC.4
MPHCPRTTTMSGPAIDVIVRNTKRKARQHEDTAFTWAILLRAYVRAEVLVIVPRPCATVPR